MRTIHENGTCEMVIQVFVQQVRAFSHNSMASLGSKSEIFDVFLQNGCEMGVNTQYTPKYTVAILMEHVGNMR